MSTLPDFDLNLLPILLALHDTRSVSLAAQQLGMSQPGVSTALAKLRKAFDDPLFVRTSRGMEPTPRALALIPAARDVLARVQQGILETGAFDPATTTHLFSIALSDVGEMVSCRALSRRWRGRRRGLRCNLCRCHRRRSSARWRLVR